MTDIPVICSEPMVRALIEDRKTMTRRLAWAEGGPKEIRGRQYTSFKRASIWQRVKPGDRLWVREKFHVRPVLSAAHALSYCDEEDATIVGGWKMLRLLPHNHQIKRPDKAAWRPSIHLPRSMSRLTLVVTATRIEPLQAITRWDAIAEGLEKIAARSFPSDSRLGDDDEWTDWLERDAMLYPHPNPQGDEFNPLTDDPIVAFSWLWQSLHGAGAWSKNPEVVAVTFRVIKQNIDALQVAA